MRFPLLNTPSQQKITAPVNRYITGDAPPYWSGTLLERYAPVEKLLLVEVEIFHREYQAAFAGGLPMRTVHKPRG